MGLSRSPQLPLHRRTNTTSGLIIMIQVRRNEHLHGVIEYYFVDAIVSKSWIIVDTKFESQITDLSQHHSRSLSRPCQQMAERKQRLVREARQYYLTTYLGFDATFSKKLIAERERIEQEKADEKAKKAR